MICDPDNLQTDFFLLRDGPVIVTSDRLLWEKTQKWLTQKRSYETHHWTLQTKEKFHDEVSQTFSWKAQFGYAPWNGNLDALNDGAYGPPSEKKRCLIAVDNAERLKNWFGSQTASIWDIFQESSRVHLIFGLGVLYLVHSASEDEAKRWAQERGVFHLRRNGFPAGQIFKDTDTM